MNIFKRIWKKIFFTIPKPLYKKERPLCPFYGFKIEGGLLKDTDNCRCGIERYFRPCLLYMRSETIDWKNCHYYDKDIAKTINSYRVYPQEYITGLPFKFWYNYIMGDIITVIGE